MISELRLLPTASRLDVLTPFLVLVSILFLTGESWPLEKVRIAPSSPGLAAWPVHLAAKEGFFSREGLDAEIIVMRTNVGVAALVTGSIDFTTAGGSALRAAVNGAPLRVVANITKKADLWVVSRKEVQQLEGLKGKMIGVGGNWGTQFYMVYEVLRHFGIEKEVQLVSAGDVSNGFISLQQGTIGAVALTPPYSVMARRMGYRVLVRTGDILSAWPTTGLVTTKEKLEKEPDKVRRVVRVVMRATQFAKSRSPEMVHFISRQYKLEREIAGEVYDAIMETLNPTLWLSDQEIQMELRRIGEQTKTKMNASVPDLVDFSFVRQAAKDLGL